MSAIQSVIGWETSARQQRESYEARTQLLPELPIIGRLHLLEAVPGALRPDAHPKEFELHLVQEGCLELWVDDPEHHYAVTGGLAIITQPGQKHGGVRETLNPGRWSMLRFTVAPGTRSQGCTLSNKQVADLQKMLARVDPPVFPYSPSLENCFEKLLNEHRHPTGMSRFMARLLLHELIIWIARDHEASVAAPVRPQAGFSPPIQTAVEWLDKHVGEPVLVEYAAEAAGLSESYFRRWFQKEVGFSPADYLMYRRIQIAKEMLRDTHQSITKVAMKLGFSTSAYFTAVFRKRTGVTPTQYRREQQVNGSAEARH